MSASFDRNAATNCCGDELREQRVFVRVEAPGYQPWEQGYRHYWTTNKVYEFPVKLERE